MNTSLTSGREIKRGPEIGMVFVQLRALQRIDSAVIF